MTEFFVSVWITNEGLRELKVQDGSTLADLAGHEGLTQYDFSVNSQLIDRSQWGSYVLTSGLELWASQGVKGA